MRFILASVIALALAVIQPVLSNPALTQPVASTVGTGGQMLNVVWGDNGNAPRTSSWGGINIFLATGDINTQFKLQQLATNLSTRTRQGSYAIDANIGPSGQFYFIRMEATQGNGTATVPMAFSARFTLQKMTGTFNSTVQAAASGAEGAAPGSTTAPTSAGISSVRITSSSTTSARPTTTATTSSSSSTSSAGKTTQALYFVFSASLAAAGLAALL